MADRRSWRARAAAVASGVLAALAAGSVAHADPAGPTDYRSVVVAVEPSTPAIDARIVGGDSFFELHVEPGTDVVVVGYQGEDMVWFRPDGSVWENRNAPSTYLNEDRFGTAGVPATATADADPDWQRVADGGSWVWHDHRAHWMQSTPPIGRSPGDVILDAEILLRVDGERVEVRVVSTWIDEPSPVAALAGAAVGLIAAVTAWWLRRRRRSPLWAAAPLAVVAAVVGAWQYRSLPAATDPRLVWIALPVVAVVCVIAGLIVGRATGRRSRFVDDAVLLVVGVELVIWGAVKRDGLDAAIIPTDAPQWLDRAATAMSLVGGASIAGLALWWLFRAAPEEGQRVQGGDGLAAPGPPVSTS